MVNSVVLVGRVQGDPSYQAAKAVFILQVARPVRTVVDGPEPADVFHVVLTGKDVQALRKAHVQHGQLIGVSGRCAGVSGGCMVLVQASSIRIMASTVAS